MLRKHWASIVVLWTAALVLGWSPSAQADQAFHTTQYPLSSVADGSVHGSVTDIHTQGPRSTRRSDICCVMSSRDRRM